MGVRRRLVNGLALVFVAVVVAALAVSAVGAFTGDGAATAQGPVETGTVTVDVKGLAFAKGTRTVAVGTTVVWRNLDDTTHTVTAKDGKSFDSRAVDTRGTFSHTFSRRGSFDYLCTIHPFMKGTITVVLPYGLEPK
jgi:plastocyanin